MRIERPFDVCPYCYTLDMVGPVLDTPEAYTKWRNQWGEYYLDIQDARISTTE